MNCRQLFSYSKGILLLAISFMLAAPLQAQPVQLDFPSASPGIPGYARIHISEIETGNVGNVPRDGEWVAVVFYRDPDCIPLDFDLGQFFHFPGPGGPGAFGCQLLTEGMELWANGPDMGDMAPVYMRARNAVPDLPIWFIDRDEFDQELADGSVFINDLVALPSLIRARAWWFEEYINPTGGAADPALSLRANGRLESGGRFSLEWHLHPSVDEDQALIVLELEDKPPASSRRIPIMCVIHPYLPNC